MDAYAVARGEGWTYQAGIDFTVKAGEARSMNGAAVLGYVTKQGDEPGNHSHATEDEMFYVLEGALTFQCGDRTLDVEAGGFVFLPRGVEHGYEIRSAGPVRLLVVTAPPRESSESWGGFVADIESSAEVVAEPSARH